MKNWIIFGALSAELLFSGAAARAQEVAATPSASQGGADLSATEDLQGQGLEDIVVTAQRRSENLQKVPISVAVATAEALTQSGVTNIQDLKMLTPGVEIQSNNGYAFPIIRGVGSKGSIAGFEPPIATYVDGVYYASASANLLQFTNIAQVEVLKGPQGTLFGRNATGGLIQIMTKDPSQTFGGEVDLGYGNYDTKRGSVYLTGGLSSSLSADISAMASAQGDGWGTNFFNGKDVYRNYHDFAVRSKWLWEASDRTQVRLILDYSNAKHNLMTQRLPVGATVQAPYGPTYGGDPWDTDVSQQPIVKLRGGGVSTRIDHDLDTVKIASITAYRRSRFITNFDGDYTRANARFANLRQLDWQFSQELQLLSNQPSSALTWVLGAFYFKASSANDPYRATVIGGGINIDAAQKTDSMSGFGQATLRIAEGLNVTGGLRYTSEKRSLDVISNPLQNASRRFKKLTWRGAIDYAITPDVLGYVSFNRGFKSGGFNTISPALPAFAPETLDAYEAGVKSTLFDRRLRFNVSGFHYNYDKVQVQRVENGASAIFNGPRAKIYGFDAEIKAQLSTNLTMDLGYQFLHGRYGSFVGLIQASPSPAGGYVLTTVNAPSGKSVIFTPESTLSARANYNVPLTSGNLNLNVSYYYNSGFYPEPDNTLREAAYSLINMSAKWSATDDRFSVSLWMNNLTNEAVSNIHGVNAVGGGRGIERISYAAPRTYGITLGSKF